MPPKIALKVGGGIIQKLPEGGVRRTIEGEVERGRRFQAIQRGMNTLEARGQIKRKKRHRVGGFQGAALIGLAMFFDFIQLILTFLIIGLIINTLLSIVIFLFFFAWFSFNGVSYFSGPHAERRFAVMSATFLAKLIPGINMMPLWTIRIMSEIRLVHREDRQYNKQQAKVAAA